MANKSTKAKAAANYGAKGGFKGVSRNRAKRMANDEVREGVSTLKKQRRLLNRDARNESRETRENYNRSIGDLNHIFGETRDYIGHQNQQINNSYTAATGRSAAAAQALQAQLSANSDANQAAMGDELARLGIQGSRTAQFEADSANAMNMAMQQGANNQANLQAMQVGSDSLGNLLLGMNAGAHQSSVGQALNARNTDLNDIRAERRDGMAEIRSAIGDVKSKRGALTRQILEQLLQTEWGQYVDQQQLNMQRQSMAGGGGSGSGSSDNTYYSDSAGYLAGLLGATVNPGTAGTGKGKKSKKSKKPPKVKYTDSGFGPQMGA